MKTKIYILCIIAAIFLAGTTALAGNNNYWTIQSGNIWASDGTVITTGYDEFGYNYQAHMFNGLYSDYDRQHGGPYSDVHLIMKWNEEWMSNKDHDKDHTLDRHWGYDSYIGSGAWLTNHMWGSYEQDGQTCHWSYFVKIVAAPADAYQSGGYWYTIGGIEIGPAIWGAFAIIQQVDNDPCAGYSGLSYLSDNSAGLVYY